MQVRQLQPGEFPWPEMMEDSGKTLFSVQLSIAITDLRKEHGWSPKQMSPRAHVSESTIRAIENGKRGVGEDIQARIAFAFGLRSSELDALAEAVPRERGIRHRDPRERVLGE